jgi:hypothetical protein
VADLAAGALVPDRAGFELFSAVERGRYVLLTGNLQEDLSCRINGSLIFLHGRYDLLSVGTYQKGDKIRPIYLTGVHYTKQQKKMLQEVTNIPFKG